MQCCSTTHVVVFQIPDGNDDGGNEDEEDLDIDDSYYDVEEDMEELPCSANK